MNNDVFCILDQTKKNNSQFLAMNKSKYEVELHRVYREGKKTYQRSTNIIR